MPESFHISDRNLLLYADGELDSHTAGQVRNHLDSCWNCRARLADLQQTIVDFVHFYQQDSNKSLPPIDASRALLKAGLANQRLSRPPERRVRSLAAVAALVFVAVAGVLIWRLGTFQVSSTRMAVLAVPDTHLTPGAVEPISRQQACNAQFASNDPFVPDSLRKEILKNYGLTSVSADAYQIDYLVTPKLGGAAAIGNLWPQPLGNTVWNARAKDALEDRLHELVCSGQLDLATAQREISQNWVAAYQKYFHTKQPLQQQVRG